MANKRMFSLDIVDTDLFLDMPTSTQALYFHLGMRADDDGFVSSPRKITNMVNCSSDDLKLLIAKGFLISFDNGIIVIKDWKINNYIQGDRYKPTKYIDEKNQLNVEKNKSYSLIQTVNNVDTNCIQDVSNMEAQISIDKDSIDKDSIDKGSIDKVSISKDSAVIAELTHHYESCFRKLPPLIHIETLLSYLKENNMQLELIKYVMEYSSGKDDPYKYCKKVLDNNVSSMVYTVEDFKSRIKMNKGENNDGQTDDNGECKPTTSPW